MSFAQEIWHWIRVIAGLALALWGGLLTLGFSILVVIYLLTRIAGEQPQPIVCSGLIMWLITGGLPLLVGVLLLKESPVKKHWPSRIAAGVLLLFLVTGADAEFGPKNWHKAFRREKSLEVTADALKSTLVSAHLEANIITGTNLLWCGTSNWLGMSFAIWSGETSS